VSETTLNLRTPFGKTQIYHAGDQGALDRTVLFIHGCDRSKDSGKHFSHWFKSLVNYGYQAIAVDMPGYGKSAGSV